MRYSRRSTGLLLAALALASAAHAQDAYIPNQGSDDLNIVDIHDFSDNVTRSVGDQPHETIAGLDGHYVYISNRLDDTLAVFDATTRAEVDTDGDPGNGVTRIAVGSEPHGLALTPDGRYLLVANDGSNDLTVVDARTFAVVSTVPEVGLAPHMVAVRPGGREAWVGNISGGDVSLVDMEKAISEPADAVICVTPGGSGPECRIPAGAGTEGIAFTHDGRTAYAANGVANTVSVIDATARTVIDTLPVAGSPRRVHVSPDGKRAYVSQLFGSDVVVIDTATHELLPSETIVGVANGLGMDFRADGAVLYVSNFFSSTVTAVRLPDTADRDTIPAGINPDSVAVVREEVRGVRFLADSETLSWDTQYLADTHNVYRGSLSSLPDYGDCRNGDDPDLSDREFVDAALPAAGDGFFYLVSVGFDGREGIVGHSTEGTLREPATRCVP